jgi:hypothetical protein
VAGKTFRFSKVAMNSRFHSTKREMRMRAARGFIKFKIQISKFKGEKRGGSEGERGRGGEEVRGQRSGVRGQGADKKGRF